MGLRAIVPKKSLLTKPIILINALKLIGLLVTGCTEI